MVQNNTARIDLDEAITEELEGQTPHSHQRHSGSVPLDVDGSRSIPIDELMENLNCASERGKLLAIVELASSQKNQTAISSTHELRAPSPASTVKILTICSGLLLTSIAVIALLVAHI